MIGQENRVSRSIRSSVTLWITFVELSAMMFKTSLSSVTSNDSTVYIKDVLQISFISTDRSSYVKANALQLHLSGLIGTAGHPDMQKIRIIRFFSENRLRWQFAVQLLLFTVCGGVPASKRLDHDA
jgi:hypothetical protein